MDLNDTFESLEDGVYDPDAILDNLQEAEKEVPEDAEFYSGLIKPANRSAQTKPKG